MAQQKEPYNNQLENDSTTILKLNGRILAYLKELEAKIELQEVLLLDLRKNQNNQEPTKAYEPIRGIHGLAEFLGVSPVTAQKLKNSGKIPYAQFERLILGYFGDADPRFGDIDPPRRKWFKEQVA